VVPSSDAPELRAVAAIIALGPPPRLVGPCTLVTNGPTTIAFTSAELLRPEASSQLAVMTRLDGSAAIPVQSWMTGRYAGTGLIDLAGPIPPGHDVVPLSIGSVCASVDTRGGPAALIAVAPGQVGWTRIAIPVHIDAVGGDDVIARLATPIDAAQPAPPIEGSPLFAWFPPDPLLGRPSEVVVVALAYTYQRRTFQPRATPAIAEVVGLDDLGRALPWVVPEAEPSELVQVAGEIQDKPPTPAPPMDPLEEIRRNRS
jgi:hypothetical protein